MNHTNLEKMQGFVSQFRDAAPYISSHRGQTFVILLDGETIASDKLSGIIHDLALLHSLGVRLVLVMGARLQLDEALAKQDLKSEFFAGRRLTSAAILDVAVATIGTMRAWMESRLSMGLPNTPMQNSRLQIASGNYITGRPVGVISGVDHLYSGEIKSVNHKLIRSHLDGEAIVLLTPLAYSITGHIFNVPSQKISATVAKELRADKLIMLTAKPKISHGSANVSILSYRDLVDYKNASGCQLNSAASLYIDALCVASRSGIPRCHLVDYRIDGALLLELFTRQGIGTQISEHRNDEIRRANESDIGGILNLISPLEKAGILVKRSRERLEQEIDYFQVVVLDGLIIGCAALYPLSTDQGQLAELACIAVNPDYASQGYGEALLESLERLALTRGYKKLLVLTTQTEHWFAEHGFIPAGFENLPENRADAYNFQRNSKVLIKSLKDTHSNNSIN